MKDIKKGDEIMKQFEIGTVTYIDNGNGYYYMTVNGQNKTRIKKAEFEEAYEEYKLQQAIEEATEEAEECALDIEAEENAPVQEKPKRKPKKRLPKSIGFRATYEELGNAEVILTEKQVDFIKHLPDTCFWEKDVDSCVWIDILCDEIGGQFAGKPMTVGAMISTLCEKGLGIRSKHKVNGKKATGFELTPLGKEVALDLGL